MAAKLELIAFSLAGVMVREGRERVIRRVRDFGEGGRADCHYSNFAVNFAASNHCTSAYGLLFIQATLDGWPAETGWNFNGVLSPGTVTTKSAYLASGGVGQVLFPLTFNGANTGAIHANAQPSSTLPPNCDARPPSSPAFAVATLTVTQ